MKKFLKEYLEYSNGTVEFNGWWEIDGDRLINRCGGWHQYTPKSGDIIVEVADWEDLDYSDYLNPESEYGWLSPEGSWYGCNYFEHDIIANNILHSNDISLELCGWVKAFKGADHETEYYCDGKYTKKQYDWMLMRPSGKKFIEKYEYLFREYV